MRTLSLDNGSPEMNSRLLEPDVLFVLLPPEPQLRPELVQLREAASQGKDTHLILDLSCIEIITSPSIGSLLLLQRQLVQRDRRLVLCNPRLATKCIFRVAGLDAFFQLASDKNHALMLLRQPEQSLANDAPTKR